MTAELCPELRTVTLPLTKHRLILPPVDPVPAVQYWQGAWVELTLKVAAGAPLLVVEETLSRVLLEVAALARRGGTGAPAGEP